MTVLTNTGAKTSSANTLSKTSTRQQDAYDSKQCTGSENVHNVIVLQFLLYSVKLPITSNASFTVTHPWLIRVQFRTYVVTGAFQSSMKM